MPTLFWQSSDCMHMYMLHNQRDDKEQIATKRLSCTEGYKFFNHITGQDNTIFNKHFVGACRQVFIVGKAMVQY